MTIANQTQLTSICFGCDRVALSASSLVGELSVTLRDLPHTLFGSLASNAAPVMNRDLFDAMKASGLVLVIYYE